MERSIIGFKKRVAILTILCMMFTLMPMSVSAAANVESDISGHWAEDTIQSWVDEGTIKGYEDGSFKPENTISRAEFMTINKLTENADAANKFIDASTLVWSRVLLVQLAKPI